jgi:hypothetical protein
MLALLALSRWKSGGKRLPQPANANWSDAEMSAFVDAVGQTGVPVAAALAVYVAESGLDPHASSGAAWGLCQAQGAILRAVGWTRSPSDFADLSVAAQAPWIAKILRAQAGGIGFVPKTALELYVANFSPAAAASHAEIIYRKDARSAGERANYASNKGLDKGGKGCIDRHDLAAVLARAEGSAIYHRAIAQMQKVQS